MLSTALLLVQPVAMTDAEVAAPVVIGRVTTGQAGAASPTAMPGTSDLTPNQLFSGKSLTRAEALAACGPAAAVAFARANGKALSLDSAVAAARAVGWTAERGMTGPYGQATLLKSLGIPSVVEAGVDQGKITREVQAGRPVIIRTGGGENSHYFVAERIDPSTNRFDFGQSALVLRQSGGRRWFGLDEIAKLGVGAPTHAIFMASAVSTSGASTNGATGGGATGGGATAASVPVIGAPTGGAGARTRVVDAGGVGARLRAAPGLDARIVGLVSDGTRLTDLGSTAVASGRTWRKMATASGTTVWIDAGLLRVV